MEPVEFLGVQFVLSVIVFTLIGLHHYSRSIKVLAYTRN